MVETTTDPTVKIQQGLLQNWYWFLGGAICLGIGAWCIFDDVSDFGEGLGYERKKHKPEYGTYMKDGKVFSIFPIHHWHLGVVFLLIGCILFIVGLYLTFLSVFS